MRLKITFSFSGNRQVLPLNYQYPLSAWIYKVLGKGDKDFSNFLHEHGYRQENQKTFKLFTFSNLQFPNRMWRIIKGTDRMEIFAATAHIILSYQIPVAAEKFVTGLFKDQRVEIGDRISTVKMEVATIEMMQQPEFLETMRFSALSPVVITQVTEGNKHEQYLKPGDKDYERLFFKNLIDKHNAYLQSTDGIEFLAESPNLKLTCLTKNPFSRLQTIKAHTNEEVKVRGYLFDFEIIAPPPLIKTGYECGFGAMNALGFGCGECSDLTNNN
jgi:CRISPR-associated endoribonuclease Cas6